MMVHPLGSALLHQPKPLASRNLPDFREESEIYCEGCKDTYCSGASKAEMNETKGKIY